MSALGDRLVERRENSSYRQLPPILHRNSGFLYTENQTYLDLSSNDPYGLTQNEQLLQKTQEALGHYGMGSSGSRLLTGSTDAHARLEERLAVYKKKEAALLFNSGYQANVGIISTLFTDKDVIFSDKLNHASLLDGSRLSGAKLYRFKHNDSAHLKALLEKHRHEGEHALIVTETLFSMDGDEAPLADLIQLKQRYNTSLMVDEAHATGVMGEDGSGLATSFAPHIDFIVGTLGKAIGGQGAYLACTTETKDILINFCRAFIYSTALPASSAVWADEALRHLQNTPQLRSDLFKVIANFQEALTQRDLWQNQQSHIFPYLIGDSAKALDIAEKLRDAGIWCSAIRHPTVPQGQARLRFALTRFVKPEHISTLFEVLDNA